MNRWMSDDLLYIYDRYNLVPNYSRAKILSAKLLSAKLLIAKVLSAKLQYALKQIHLNAY